jgi:hypothetical protein
MGYLDMNPFLRDSQGVKPVGVTLTLNPPGFSSVKPVGVTLTLNPSGFSRWVALVRISPGFSSVKPFEVVASLYMKPYLNTIASKLVENTKAFE